MTQPYDPTIFAPETPALPPQPVEDPTRAYGGGIINLPGPGAGLRTGLAGAAAALEYPKQQALAMLQRLAAGVKAGILPQEVFARPDVQDLFKTAGLPPNLPIMPKVSDLQAKATAAQVGALTPAGQEIFAQTGKTPTTQEANVQGAANVASATPAVARVMGKTPTPEVAANVEATQAGQSKFNLETTKNALAALDKYGDSDFKDWSRNEAAGPGVVQQAIEKMRASSEWARLNLGQSVEAQRLMGQVMREASSEYSRRLLAWEAGINKARENAANQIIGDPEDPKTAQAKTAAADEAERAYLASEAGRNKPSFAGVVADLTGASPEDAQLMLRSYTGIKQGAGGPPKPPVKAPVTPERQQNATSMVGAIRGVEGAPAPAASDPVTIAKQRIDAAVAKGATRKTAGEAEKAHVDASNLSHADKQATKDAIDSYIKVVP